MSDLDEAQVDRVARAIDRAKYPAWAAPGAVDWDHRWTKLDPAFKDRLRSEARAAITAMHPTAGERPAEVVVPTVRCGDCGTVVDLPELAERFIRQRARAASPTAGDPELARWPSLLEAAKGACPHPGGPCWSPAESCWRGCFEQGASDEAVARLLHHTYERLAPAHNWETQERSRTPWEELPPENRSLMVATVREVRAALQPAIDIAAVAALPADGGGG